MKSLRTITLILLISVAANALVAGYLFMSDTSGAKLGTSVNLLRFTKFDTFFLPGLILFVVHGVLGSITAIALIRRWTYYPVRLCFQGLMLTGWIVIQIALIREFNFLHAILGATGIFFIAAGIVMLKHPVQ